MAPSNIGLGINGVNLFTTTPPITPTQSSWPSAWSHVESENTEINNNITNSSHKAKSTTSYNSDDIKEAYLNLEKFKLLYKRLHPKNNEISGSATSQEDKTKKLNFYFIEKFKEVTGEFKAEELEAEELETEKLKIEKLESKISSILHEEISKYDDIQAKAEFDRLKSNQHEWVSILKGSINNDIELIKKEREEKTKTANDIKAEISNTINASFLSEETKKTLHTLIENAIHVGGLALAISVCLCFPLCFPNSPGAWTPIVMEIAGAAIHAGRQKDVKNIESEPDQAATLKDTLQEFAKKNKDLKKELDQYPGKLLSIDADKTRLNYILNEYKLNEYKPIDLDRRNSKSFPSSRRQSLASIVTHSKTSSPRWNQTANNSPALSPTEIRRQSLNNSPIAQKGSEFGSPSDTILSRIMPYSSSPIMEISENSFSKESHKSVEYIPEMEEPEDPVFENDASNSELNAVTLFEGEAVGILNDKFSILKDSVIKILNACFENYPGMLDDLLKEPNSKFENYKIEVKKLSHAESFHQQIQINNTIDVSIKFAFEIFEAFLKIIKESFQRYASDIQDIIHPKDESKRENTDKFNKAIFDQHILFRENLLNQVKEQNNSIQAESKKLINEYEENKNAQTSLTKENYSSIINGLIDEFDRNISIKFNLLRNINKTFITSLKNNILNEVDETDNAGKAYAMQYITIKNETESNLSEIDSQEIAPA